MPERHSRIRVVKHRPCNLCKGGAFGSDARWPLGEQPEWALQSTPGILHSKEPTPRYNTAFSLTRTHSLNREIHGSLNTLEVISLTSSPSRVVGLQVKAAVMWAHRTNRDLSLKLGAWDTLQGVSCLSGIWNWDRQCKTGIVKRNIDGRATRTTAGGVRNHVSYLTECFSSSLLT